MTRAAESGRARKRPAGTRLEPWRRPESGFLSRGSTFSGILLVALATSCLWPRGRVIGPPPAIRRVRIAAPRGPCPPVDRSPRPVCTAVRVPASFSSFAGVVRTDPSGSARDPLAIAAVRCTRTCAAARFRLPQPAGSHAHVCLTHQLLFEVTIGFRRPGHVRLARITSVRRHGAPAQAGQAARCDGPRGATLERPASSRSAARRRAAAEARVRTPRGSAASRRARSRPRSAPRRSLWRAESSARRAPRRAGSSA